MFLQFEDSAIVGPNSFKNAVAVKQSMIENGNLGIALSIIPAINKYFQCHSLAQTLWQNRGVDQQDTGAGRCMVDTKYWDTGSWM